MQTVAKTTQSKLDYDKTYRGYVISQNSNGKYKIKINGHIYENVDNPSGYTISSGDVVRVTFPQNNASQCYICLGSTKDGAVSNVKSVNGKTGDVQLTQDDIPNGNTYVRTHNDFTTEDKNTMRDALTAAQDAQSNASSALTEVQSKAPISHASSSTTYGKGTDALYGHVKLSNSVDSTSGASSGVAATPAAVKKAYDAATAAQTTAESAKNTAESIKGTADTALAASQTAQAAAESAKTVAESAQAAVGDKAPTSHASSSTTYGKGTSSLYGHVKLSDSTTSTSESTSGGTAATPKAVKTVYDLLGGAKIITGTATISFYSTKMGSVSVSFGHTFQSPPFVIAMQVFNGLPLAALYTKVTTTGCEFTIDKLTANGNRTFKWLAVGK